MTLRLLNMLSRSVEPSAPLARWPVAAGGARVDAQSSCSMVCPASRAALIAALVIAPERLLAQCPEGTPPPCAGQRVVAPRPSVAVLFFENRTADAAYAYLADGLTEEIITRLWG